MSIEKKWVGGEETYTPVCDVCGDELDYEYDFYDAVDAKKRAGWRSRQINGEWIDVCDRCLEDEKQDKAERDYRGIREGMKWD